MTAIARWLAALACLALALSVSWPQVRSESAGVDYYQFWIVGRARTVLGISDVYSAASRDRMAELGRRIADGLVRSSGRLRACTEYRATIESFATPFLYALVSGAASGDYDTDLRRFHFVSIAVFVAAIVALAALLGYRLETGIFAAAIFVAASDPLAADVRTGNVGELQLGGLSLFLALRRGRPSRARESLAGGVLGVLVAAKPTLGMVPVLLACLLLADRRIRSLAALGSGALVASLVAAAVGAAFLGSWHAWLDWLRALGGLASVSDISVANGNFALAQWVAEAAGPPVALALGLTIALALAACAALARTREPGSSDEERRLEREYLALAFGSAIAALTLQLVWLHYYLLLIPLSLFLLRPEQRRQRRWMALAALLAAVALLGRPMREFVGLANPETQAPVYVLAAWLSALIGVASAPRASLRQSASVPAH